MSDDAVGPIVAGKVHAQVKKHLDADLVEASVGGLGLIDIIAGYDSAIIVDAVQTDGGNPGDLYFLDLEIMQANQQKRY